MDSTAVDIAVRQQRSEAGDVAYALVRTDTGEALAIGILPYSKARRYAAALMDDTPLDGADVVPVDGAPHGPATVGSRDVDGRPLPALDGLVPVVPSRGGAAARPRAHYAGARVSERRGGGVTRAALAALGRIGERALRDGGALSWR